MTPVIVGTDETDLRDRVRRVSAVHDQDAEALVANPPPGWIIGTVEQAAEQLASLRDAGVRRVMCQHLIHDDLDTVALIGRELAPRVA